MTPEQEIKRLTELFGAFFLWVNDQANTQKYTFKFEEGKKHYTVRFWSINKEIDLHSTDENYEQGDPRRHQEIFRISYFSVKRILVAMRKFDYRGFAKGMMQNKIRVGKLKRYKSLLVPMDNSASVDFLTVKHKRSGKRYRVKKHFDIFENMKAIEVEDGLDHPIKCHMVIQYRRGCWRLNGHVYRFPGTSFHGPRSFAYFSPKANKKLRRDFMENLMDAIRYINFKNKEKVFHDLCEKYPPLRRYLRN